MSIALTQATTQIATLTQMPNESHRCHRIGTSLRSSDVTLHSQLTQEIIAQVAQGATYTHTDDN
jgi:hypothetical protein